MDYKELAESAFKHAKVFKMEGEFSRAAGIERYANAIIDLLSRAEAAEAAQETLHRSMAEYKARAEKAERERDEYFKHLIGLCFCCAHRTDGFDCKAKCYGHKRGSAWVYAGPAKEE